jgi:hypothetical protein
METNHTPSKADNILKYVALLILAGSVITSFVEIPSATYLIDFYCKIFDTQKYYPVLTALIMMLIGMLLLVAIKKIFFGTKQKYKPEIAKTSVHPYPHYSNNNAA